MTYYCFFCRLKNYTLLIENIIIVNQSLLFYTARVVATQTTPAAAAAQAHQPANKKSQTTKQKTNTPKQNCVSSLAGSLYQNTATPGLVIIVVDYRETKHVFVVIYTTMCRVGSR